LWLLMRASDAPTTTYFLDFLDRNLEGSRSIMLKWLFMAENEDPFRSMFRKLTMGLMFGLAIGWVVLRIRRPGDGSQGNRGTGKIPDEIDITDLEEIVEQESAGTIDETFEELVEDISPTPKITAAKRQQSTKVKRDRLEAIKGIGPVFAKRMNAAGIFTYADLADQDPEKLLAIVEAKPWQAADPAEWIAQARSLTH
jgi:predicted flap endonuclease-1-like 5' DNA nuclease